MRPVDTSRQGASMVDFYDENALSYFKQTAAIDPGGFLSPFIRHIPAGARVLDVGCGSGRDLLWLRKKGYRVRGMERSREMADLARRHAGCEVVEADFETWNFAENPVEGLLLVGALVHIAPEAFGRMLCRVARGVVSGGKILLTLKEGNGQNRLPDGRVFYLWQDQTLQKLLKQLGFQVIYFHRAVSAIREDDVWLTYILEKEDKKRKQGCPLPF